MILDAPGNTVYSNFILAIDCIIEAYVYTPHLICIVRALAVTLLASFFGPP